MIRQYVHNVQMINTTERGSFRLTNLPDLVHKRRFKSAETNIN